MSAEQGTQEWLQERAGHCTASEMSAVLAKLKNGNEAATRRNYRMRLVTERLINGPVPSYENEAMRWGKEQEPFARMAYEERNGVIVEPSPFLKHPKIQWLGCSPDGTIDDDGGAEIKCPFNSAVHVETLEVGMPPEHIAQIQASMLVTGRKWWDFLSFDPRMPEHLRLYVQRIQRDDAYIGNLIAEIGRFLAEVDALYRKLMERKP